MLLHCNNYAFAKTPKTPSYPPVRGRLDTETSLEEGRKNEWMNERKERKNEWKEETQAESVIYLPPRGIRGGLRVFFFSFYLYIFLSLYKKENK